MIYGSMDSWIHGFPDSWIPGFLGPRIPGSMDPWIPGSLAPWIWGARGRGGGRGGMGKLFTLVYDLNKSENRKYEYKQA